MLRYVLSRLLYMLPVVWLVVSVVFLLIHLVPGDPIQLMLGEGAAATDVAAARHAYGLDVPLGQQYVHYWRGILHGDMGLSIRMNQNVGHIITQAYPATMELTLAALIVALKPVRVARMEAADARRVRQLIDHVQRRQKL